VKALEGQTVETAWGPIEMRACDHQAQIPLWWGTTAKVPEYGFISVAKDIQVFDPKEILDLYWTCEEIEEKRKAS